MLQFSNLVLRNRSSFTSRRPVNKDIPNTSPIKSPVLPFVNQSKTFYTAVTLPPDSSSAPCAHYSIEGEYVVDPPHSLTSTFERLKIRSSDIRDVTNRCWNSTNTETSYQPDYMSLKPFQLSKNDQAVVNQLSDLAYFGADKMHQNTFSNTLKSIDEQHFYDVIYYCICDYLNEPNDDIKTTKAQALNDAFIAIGWLEKYWLFEGFKVKNKANFIVPAVISKPYSLLAVLFGNQTEFLYYGHYVGASCSNMQAMREMMQQVDFNNTQSIANWLISFDALYDVQSIYDQSLGDEDPDAVLQSDRTFRFIHLAMEMVFSRDISKIRTLIDNALLATGSKQKMLTLDALKLLQQTETDMHAVFKTLPKVSLPKHYNSFVRPFIAGTFGQNCGTVYHPKGKFFVGCGEDSHFDSHTAVLYKGKWKQHVGQTGAQTSARVILDMFFSLATNALKQPVDPDLIQCIMMDDQKGIQSYIRKYNGNPLTLQLTLFRATCRPPNHNHQIVEAWETSKKWMNIIFKDNDCVNALIKGQIGALKHRILHYRFVQAFINDFSAPTSQERGIATGGTKTYDFLPNVTASVLADIRNVMTHLTNDSDVKKWESQLHPYEKTSNQIREKTKRIAQDEQNKRRT